MTGHEPSNSSGGKRLCFGLESRQVRGLDVGTSGELGSHAGEMPMLDLGRAVGVPIRLSAYPPIRCLRLGVCTYPVHCLLVRWLTSPVRVTNISFYMPLHLKCGD